MKNGQQTIQAQTVPLAHNLRQSAGDETNANMLSLAQLFAEYTGESVRN